MKKALLAVGVVLALLLAVVLAKTAMVESKQVRTEPVTDLAVDARAAAERLAGAIRFPTISHEDPAKVEDAAFRGLHALRPPGRGRAGDRGCPPWERRHPCRPSSLS